ncbi:MAG: hypothetical protein CM15mP113_2450 [Pseudomonadota bacterium]|nr:MAG: hypothetical protein CM15mP113_2450 [Pseudomonadota bacterium]
MTIRKTSDASLEIVGESGQTKVSLGKSDTDGNESALIRYGNPDGSLNFVNYNLVLLIHSFMQVLAQVFRLVDSHGYMVRVMQNYYH